MNSDQFARVLYQGLGRTIVYARSHDCSPFYTVILQACLYNPIYDRQTGVDRAPYLHELIAATGAEPWFRAHILAALADPDDEMDRELLFDLALRFAQEGDGAARTTMLARFLDNVSCGEINGAYQIAELDDKASLRFVVEQIGAAMQRAVDFSECWISEHFLDDLEAAYSHEPEILNDARIATFRQMVRRSPDEQRIYEQEKAQRKELRTRLLDLTYTDVHQAVASKLLNLKDLWGWGQHTSDTELRRAADDVLALTESNLQWRLLAIFDERDFPYGYASLLPLLDHPKDLVRFRAAHVLARFRHPELRARALQLLAAADTLEYGLILLLGNYEAGDYAMLAALVQPMPDQNFEFRSQESEGQAGQLSDENLHALVSRVHDLFVRYPAPEAAELLLLLYESGPCDQCRDNIVADLLDLDALPPRIAEECRFDANDQIRDLVEARAQ
ncbi:hypothetical protein HC891_12550 [Candidatus Gracilibacteria bacterium]|nr:hypothetical protein [Candidatus Gracilibacteria bacterium]